ncbi:DUF3606 domain-containing protein [Microvirga sp. 2MCAF38]|uniref:DUF3606 domain-containing protein n=1 Tax=Microvirga sp. 2MCAF38 TaxID=3232989 RepID=UPI003F9DEDA3
MDNLKIRQPQDPKKVNIHEEWEVKHWTAKWNVTREQLVDAVKRVGVNTVDVARYLGKPL